jgi:L-ascorbate metabolism protein UlaG (beta-lactamase superfamily)
MHLRLIRNATLRLEVDGRQLLVDPMLGADLPEPAEVVVAGVDAVLVTRLQRDRFDDAAAELVPKDVPVLCRPEDAAGLRDRGFADVRPVARSERLDGIDVTRTGGGYLLRDSGGRRLYLAGDTVVDEVLDERPEVVVVDADAHDVVAVAHRVPDARVVAVHLDAVERADVHQRVHEQELTDRVTVPEDGAAVPVG